MDSWVEERQVDSEKGEIERAPKRRRTKSLNIKESEESTGDIGGAKHLKSFKLITPPAENNSNVKKRKKKKSYNAPTDE